MVSESKSDQKNESLYMLREMRHLGCALAFDTLRLLGIDVDLRSHCDYLYLKAQGIESLPSDMFFLHSYFDPKFIRNMQPWEFVLVNRKGSLGVGLFENHDWYKKERENIVSAVGLKIEYGEPEETAVDRGTFKGVTSKEYSEIIAKYVEGNVGMATLAKELGRSSRTIMQHIHNHNSAIERSGFCPNCKKAGGQHQNRKAERKKLKFDF